MDKLITKGLLVLSLVLTFSLHAQEKQVSGTILDVAGLPLPGATVTIKGTSAGVSSDFDGNFVITVNENDILTISFMGFITQQINVSGKTTINVTLVVDANQLDEVIVVGFGTQKKSSISGAITNVAMEKVVGDRPLTNIAGALQGQVSGLQVVNTGSQPGGNQTSLQLRGFGSINNSSAPLILLDNVEVALEDVNPNDVKSISVLKDAAASSIYGARAAWGVILITSKTPEREQKAKIDFKTSVSFSSPLELIEKASVSQFVNMLDEIGIARYWSNQDVKTWIGYLDDYKVNPGSYPTGVVFDPDGYNYSLTETYPINQLMDNQGVKYINNLTFSGGSEKTSYRVSYGYSKEDGIIVTDNDSYKKFNVNAYINTDLTSNLKSTTNIFYRKSNRSAPAGRYKEAESNNVWLPTGYYTMEDGTTLPFDSPDNLERLLVHGIQKKDVFRGLQRLEYEPIENLKFTGDFTFERGTTTNQSQNIQLATISRTKYEPNNSNPENTSVSKSLSEFESNVINLYANYNKSMNDVHNFGAMVGYNREQNSFNAFSVNRNNLLSTDVPSVDAALGLYGGSDSASETAVQGYFGRLQYNYKEKYFIEANLRYDGSSKFPESDRYGLFPSFSAAWNVKKESFMESTDWLSLMKFRGSYGEIGNQAVGQAYPYISQWGPRTTWLLNEAGERATTITPGLLVSPSLTWETVQKTDIGLDIAFLKSRLSGTFDVYRNRTINMLMPGAELPSILGTDAPVTNAADLETKGWEAALSWRDSKNDFSYGIAVNASNSESKITDFDNAAGLISQYYVGQTIGEIWGYVTDGYYTVDDFVDGTLDANLVGPDRQLKDGVVANNNGAIPYPGDIKYTDLDGDGVITNGNQTIYYEYDENGDLIDRTGPGDRKVIGNSRRKMLFGIQGNAAYKGFDISFALSGVGKRDMTIQGTKAFPYPGQFDNMYAHQLDYWTPENINSFYPRMYGDNTNFSGDRGNYGLSRNTQTKYLYDGSYLKIDNITLGYNLSEATLKSVNIDKIRLFVSGENLKTFKNLPKGIHPDQLTDTGTYPYMKNIAFGAQIIF